MDVKLQLSRESSATSAPTPQQTFNLAGLTSVSAAENTFAPAAALFPPVIRTGDAAKAHAQAIARQTPDVPRQHTFQNPTPPFEQPYTSLSSYLAGAEVLGTYNNIIIVGDASQSPEENQAFLDATLRDLNGLAAFGRGREILTAAQGRSYPLVIQPGTDSHFRPAENVQLASSFIPVDASDNNRIRFVSNFDVLSLNPPGTEEVTIGSQTYRLPDPLVLGHELGHRINAVDSRREFLESSPTSTDETLPFGAAATLWQRLRSDVVDENGEAEPNGVADEEDRTLLLFEKPLAEEMGIEPRPRYQDDGFSSGNYGEQAPLPSL